MDTQKIIKESQEKDQIAYELLLKIAPGRTYLEAFEIIDRMQKQLSAWRDLGICKPLPYAIDRYNRKVEPPPSTCDYITEQGEQKGDT